MDYLLHLFILLISVQSDGRAPSAGQRVGPVVGPEGGKYPGGDNPNPNPNLNPSNPHNSNLNNPNIPGNQGPRVGPPGVRPPGNVSWSSEEMQRMLLNRPDVKAQAQAIMSSRTLQDADKKLQIRELLKKLR